MFIANDRTSPGLYYLPPRRQIALFFFLLFSPLLITAAESDLLDAAELETSINVSSSLFTAEFTDSQTIDAEVRLLDFVRNELIPSVESSNSSFDWQRNQSDQVTLSSNNGLSWFYLDLANSGDQSKQIILEFINIDGVGWVDYDELGEMRLNQPGYDQYIGGRKIFDIEYAVPIEIAPQSTSRLIGFTYIVSSPRVAEIRAWDAEAFRTQRTQQYFGDGAYYGFLFALVIYNLALALIVRQIAYLYAAVFQLCVGAIIFISTGYSTLFLFADNQIYTIPVFGIFITLANISSGLFSITILQIKQYSQILYRIWMVMIIWGILQIPLITLTAMPSGIETNSNRILLVLNTLVFLVSQGLHVYTLVYFWKKVSIAKYWFTAITLQVWVVMFWQITVPLGIFSAELFKLVVQAFTLLNGAVLSWLIGVTLRGEQHDRMLAQQEALASLKMANDIQLSKANFISTAGHDLRQPLQAIRLHIEALQQTASDSTANVLNKVEKNIVELSALLNSLMNLSKSNSYIDQDADEEFLLDEVFSNLYEEIQPFAAQKGIELKIKEAPYLVRTSKVGLAQILRNLLNNSVKFTREGEVNVRVERIGEEVCISVVDSGPGIADDELERIFEEFYQVESQEKSKGMGIGLSIVKRLSDALELPLQVESKVGSGTEFNLRIKAATTAKIKRSFSSDPTSLSGLKVAIVHFSSQRCNELKSTLEQWGAMALAWTDLESLEEYIEKHEWRPHMLIVGQSNLRDHTESDPLQDIVHPALEIPTIVLSMDARNSREQSHRTDNTDSHRFHWFTDPLAPGVLRSFIQRVVINPVT